MARAKAKKEPILFERPLLTELIYMLQSIRKRSMSVVEWNEIFYNMAQQPEAPRCLKELLWHQRNGFLQSDDLTDLLRFNEALQKCPGNIG